MGRKKKTNVILEDHGEWLLIDISTPTHSKATMCVDTSVWLNYSGGRVSANRSKKNSYIRASYSHKGATKFFHHNVLPLHESLLCDHIVHSTDEIIDNRISNLRYSTNSENCRNKSINPRNTSGFTGISLNSEKTKWEACIYINNKTKHLGFYDNKCDAIKVRKEAEAKYYGEFAFNSRNN